MSAGAAPRLTTVFFDFGDTIWHFPQRPPQAWIDRAKDRRARALCSLWGIDPRLAHELRRAISAAASAAERAADAEGLSGPDYLALTRRITTDAGLALDDRQVAMLWEAEGSTGPFLGRRIFDDTRETLQWLLDGGFRVGAITNRSHGGQPFLDELRYHDLLRYFEVVVSSDQVGWRKPHAAIFEHALDAMGVRPHESALVGDRPEADLRGARDAGMTAIWMRKVTPPDRVPRGPDEQPHYTIDELSDLRSLPPIRRSPARRRRR